MEVGREVGKVAHRYDFLEHGHDETAGKVYPPSQFLSWADLASVSSICPCYEVQEVVVAQELLSGYSPPPTLSPVKESQEEDSDESKNPKIFHRLLPGFLSLSRAQALTA